MQNLMSGWRSWVKISWNNENWTQKNKLSILCQERCENVCWWINLNSLLKSGSAEHLLKLAYNFKLRGNFVLQKGKSAHLWIIDILTLTWYVFKIHRREMTLVLLLMFPERKARQKENISSSIKKAFKPFCLNFTNASFRQINHVALLLY